MTAATLHQVCGGRYVLGLGASTKALVEGFHGTAFEHPAAKLRDVVTKVRTLLAGQPSSATPRPRGRCAWASRSPRGTHLGRRAGPSHDPVAAELDDGWISALVARDRLAGAAVRSASSPTPPHHTRDPSRSRPGPSLPSTKTPTRPGPSPQAIPPGT
jgi:alkanesulfonate monooxygenase SsuD/methylene tetrahydromethanopterin reductase-like flavin-dependent oxidoreductase (luciferase family)